MIFGTERQLAYIPPMPKFPQLLVLLVLAMPARAEAFVSGLSTQVEHLSAQAIAAVPEPGVFIALISGAAMLLARRRRR
jgi:hypothetical protein